MCLRAECVSGGVNEHRIMDRNRPNFGHRMLIQLKRVDPSEGVVIRELMQFMTRINI